jgi:hypothetical protein
LRRNQWIVASSIWPAQEAKALPHGNATLQQEGADLIDDAGALSGQPLTHAPSVYRSIEKWQPSFVIDEADAIFFALADVDRRRGRGPE